MRYETWIHDGKKCTHCGKKVPLSKCHIDHVKSGKLAGNESSNRRTLCERCHVLRADPRHRGMISRALKKGIIPYDWRNLVWDEKYK